MSQVHVQDAMRGIVDKVSAAKLVTLQAQEPTITGVYFEHGHPVEITNTLSQKNGTEFVFQKYPLIALFEDFPIDHDGGTELGKTRLHMIIAKGTDPNYTAEQRLNENFKKFLYPIYVELLRQLKRSKIFGSGGSFVQHTQIDRFFWGKEGLYGVTGNVFNDYVDCIELRDLQLNINTLNC